MRYELEFPMTLFVEAMRESFKENLEENLEMKETSRRSFRQYGRYMVFTQERQNSSCHNYSNF